MRKSWQAASILLCLILAFACFASTVSVAVAADAERQTGDGSRWVWVEAAAPAAQEDLSALEDEVIRLTNAERIKHGLWPLKKSSILTQAARGHNLDMIRNDFASHTGSDGFSSAQRALAAGYRPYGWGSAYVGENIAAGMHTAAEAVQAWLNSPPHRANLLRPEYREIGVGVNKGGRYGTYFTQNFGAAPGVFPAFVNEGASVVESPDVTLTLTNETISAWGSMGPAVQMMIASDETFAGAAWQPYTPQLSWRLSEGSGVKSLHVRLRDAQGKVGYTRVDVELRPAVAAVAGTS